LFPWYLWLPKLVATVALVTVLIPLACGGCSRREVDRIDAAAGAESRGAGRPAGQLRIAGPSSRRHLGLVAQCDMDRSNVRCASVVGGAPAAVPLMLLAGLLGSVLITIVPWDAIARFATVGGGLPSLADDGRARGAGDLSPRADDVRCDHL